MLNIQVYLSLSLRIEMLSNRRDNRELKLNNNRCKWTKLCKQPMYRLRQPVLVTQKGVLNVGSR